MNDPAWLLGLTKHTWNAIGTVALCVALSPLAFAPLALLFSLWRELYRLVRGRDNFFSWIARGPRK